MDFTEADRESVESLLAQAQESILRLEREAQDAAANLATVKDWQDTLRAILADLDSRAL